MSWRLGVVCSTHLKGTSDRFYEEKLCSLDRKKKDHCISCCKLKHFFWITSRRKKKKVFFFSWFLLKKTPNIFRSIQLSEAQPGGKKSPYQIIVLRFFTKYWERTREQVVRNCSASTFPEVTILFFIWSREWKMNFIPSTAAVPVTMGRQHWPNGFHKQLRLATPNP